MVAAPFFKFTLFNDGLYPGGVVMNMPMGWNDGKLKLERDNVFHSLIEYYEGEYVWYGNARGIIEEIEDDQGVNAKIRILIEVRYQNAWDTLFDGQIDLSQLEDIAKANTFYKTKAPIIRDDFWARFINRKSTIVNLNASVDIFGNARTPVAEITLQLPSQKIRAMFNGNLISGLGYHSGEMSTATDKYIQLDVDNIILDEIEEKFSIPNAINSALPVSIMDVKYGGLYQFNLRVESSIAYYTFGACVVTFNLTPTSPYHNYYFQINNGTPIAFSVADNSESTVYTYNDSHILSANDSIRVYGVDEDGAWESLGVVANTVIWGNDNTAVPIKIAIPIPPIGGDPCTFAISTEKTPIDIGATPSSALIPTFFEVTGDTLFTDSETEAFLIKDAFESVLSKITGFDNVVDSDFLDPDGCAGLLAIMKGLHVRGYSFTEKPLFQSFDDLWACIDPLHCLGLGYIDGENKIEIENRGSFFDLVPVVNFSNVPNLIRSYDLEKHFKTAEVGFQKWSAESASGIDDPQSKHTYSSILSNFGEDAKILSKLYMASLGIEQARRKRVTETEDYRLDEDLIGIRLKQDSDGYSPELGIEFNTTNVLNPDERYNLRDTPATILKRHQEFLQGCLQSYLTSTFKFQGGEGNYDMTKEFPEYDCEFPNLNLDEKQDIQVTDDFMFIPKLYKCNVPMNYSTYRTIRQNRKKAVGISRTTENHVPMFIMNLEYQLMNGNAELTLLAGSNVKP